MSTSKSEGSDRRYSDICGATNRNGEPCQLPAGWGTPGSGGERCKFHGGLSTGPTDTSHLEENSYAEGNPGGGAPELNTNAEVHGGFSDWRKAYDRLNDDTKAYVDKLREDMRAVAKEYAPDVPEERRGRLIKEHATLSVLSHKPEYDAWGSGEDARGLFVAEEREIDGETYTVEKLNPAFTAATRIRGRQYSIAKELRLWPGFRDREE